METANTATKVSTTQYDTITSGYSILYPPSESVRSPFLPALLEEAQIKHALLSFSLSGKSVLDLAGGSGYYSFRLLSWGAARVTSVDISSAQVEAGQAEAKRRGLSDERVRFLVGDVGAQAFSVPSSDGSGKDRELQPGSGQYDIVLAAWLLNYASSATELCGMFANIAAQLKPGGLFIGLTTPPILTADLWEEAALASAYSPTGYWGRWGTEGEVLAAMPGGEGYRVLTKLHLVGNDEGATRNSSVNFENHHIRRDVIDEAAAGTGKLSRLKWLDWTCPDDLREELPEYTTDAALLPHCRVCVTQRIV